MLDLGDVYQVAVDIRDAAGALANPASATLTITLPDGTTTTPAVSLPPAVTGKVRHDYTTVQAGRHVYRLVTTGPVTAHTDMFDVAAAEPGQIVSLAEAKAQLNMTAATTIDDEELRGFILAATSVVEGYVGAIVRRTWTQSSDGGRAAIVLAHAPVLSVSSVTESGTLLTAADYRLDQASGVLTRMAGDWPYAWEAGVGNITATYVAGRTAVAANHSRAALIIIQHMWETQRPAARGPYAGQSDDFDPRYVYSIPRRALELLGEPVGGIA